MPRKKLSKNQPPNSGNTEASSSEDEWEDVAEINNNECKENVEIELEMPNTMKSKQTKKMEQAKEWITVLIKRAINKSIKEIQIRMHKTHLLCLLGLGLQLNHICSNKELQSFALSILDTSFLKQRLFTSNKENVERILSFLSSKFALAISEKFSLSFVSSRTTSLKTAFATGIVESEIDLILARKKVKQISSFSHLQIPQLDGTADDVSSSKKKSLRRKSPVVRQVANRDDSEESSTKKRKCAARSTAKKPPSHKNISKYVFSSDESSSPADENLPAATKISAMAKMFNAKAKANNLKQLDSVCTVDLAKLAVDEKSCSSNKKPTARKKNQNTCQSSSTKHKTKNDADSLSKSPKPPKQAKLAKQKDGSVTNRKIKKVLPEKRMDSEATKLRQRATKKNYIDKVSDVESNSDDIDFDYDKEVFGKQQKKNRKRTSTASARKISTDKRSSKSNHHRNQWIEVYIKKVGWVPVDCFTGLIADPRQMEESTKKPLHYILAFDNDESVKDVTVRYASDWLITTRKLRVNSVEQDWWKQTLNLYKTKNKKRDEEENKQLESNLLSQPLPTSVSAFKNHPLFALRRHLLKYEAIYPPDIPSIGFIKGEEILPRSSVQVLHTREKWLQSALSVKSGETPYKMVASYLLNKKLNRDSDAPSLALFGKWQTESYQPPVAENSKVPRNDYGNVDLFQPSMLPIGCVHIRLPSLNVVARKLNIDIATAVVGFDTHHGYPHPVTDGYVACKEHEVVLKEAWEEEQAHAEERARQKIEKRVYLHWKIFIRGLLALEKVRKKYSSQVEPNDHLTNSQIQKTPAGDVAWQASKLREAKKRHEQKSRRTRKKKDEDLFPVEVETM